jgi:putative hydrolase of the HAD superfamily
VTTQNQGFMKESTRNMMKDSWPRAIFLDLDDTIIAYSYGAAECWERLCTEYAGKIGGIHRDALSAALWGVQRWYWNDTERHRSGRLDLQRARREIVGQAFQNLGLAHQRLAEEMADYFTFTREEVVELFPGAMDALRTLRRQTDCLALITNGHAVPQRKKIAKFGLEGFFDCILVEGEFGAGKPDEQVYLHCLERLKVEPDETWMVGDNLEFDVAGPQRLGIKGIWLDHAAKGLPEGTSVQPDRIIRHLSELLEVRPNQLTKEEI